MHPISPTPSPKFRNFSHQRSSSPIQFAPMETAPFPFFPATGFSPTPAHGPYTFPSAAPYPPPPFPGGYCTSPFHFFCSAPPAFPSPILTQIDPNRPPHPSPSPIHGDSHIFLHQHTHLPYSQLHPPPAATTTTAPPHCPDRIPGVPLLAESSRPTFLTTAYKVSPVLAPLLELTNGNRPILKEMEPVLTEPLCRHDRVPNASLPSGRSSPAPWLLDTVPIAPNRERSLPTPISTPRDKEEEDDGRPRARTALSRRRRAAAPSTLRCPTPSTRAPSPPRTTEPMDDAVVQAVVDEWIPVNDAICLRLQRELDQQQARERIANC
jgi:hypothetical protein